MTVVDPLHGAPSVHVVEEEILTFGAEEISKGFSGFSADLAGRANDDMDLINPTTGAVIRTAKVRDVYIHLYSLYLHLAALRDAGTLEQTQP
jgi:hypothetical protein